MILRDYQQSCISQVLKKWKEFDKLLAILPTGAGKTIVFSKLISGLPGKKLILAHREELLTQAQDKLTKSTGLISALEKAGSHASKDDEIVVASIQTLINTKYSFSKDHFDYIIVDEAHRTISDSYLSILNYFKGAKVLGVTATPDRGDKKNLGLYYEDIAYERTLLDMIREKYLVPITVKQVPIDIDLTGLTQSMGDYSVNSCNDALEPYLMEIVLMVKSYIGLRKTLVFLPLVETSMKFADLCNMAGIRAAHVDGMSKDRKEILKGFADNKFQLLTNSMLLTEGYDEPSIECVINLRPTKNRALYAQIIGRGTRLSPSTGKENLLVLDFLFQAGRLPLIHPAHLIAETDEIAKLAQKDGDLCESVEKAIADREESLRKQLEKQRNKQARVIDPTTLALQFHDPELFDYEPVMKWEYQNPTSKQLDMLRKYGIDTSKVIYKGHANKIIDRLINRGKMKLSTPKQLGLLIKWGIPNAEEITMKEASEIIGNRFKR